MAREITLEKDKYSMYMFHDPVSINIHMVGQYIQNMPQERTVLCSECSGKGSRPKAQIQAGFKSVLGESKTYVSYVMVRISIPGFQRMWV